MGVLVALMASSYGEKMRWPVRRLIEKLQKASPPDADLTVSIAEWFAELAG